MTNTTKQTTEELILATIGTPCPRVPDGMGVMYRTIVRAVEAAGLTVTEANKVLQDLEDQGAITVRHCRWYLA